MLPKEAIQVIQKLRENPKALSKLDVEGIEEALTVALEGLLIMVTPPMTLKDTIETLETWIMNADDEYDMEEHGRVLGMKNALHLIRKIQPEPCDDCISRKTATDRFDLVQQDDLSMSYDDIAEFLSKLPPVYPKPKIGTWKYILRDSENEEYRCSICNNPVSNPTKFCCDCGAKMENHNE